MELEYSVLWIDDQVDSIEGSASDIEDYIDSQGYDPDVLVMAPYSDNDVNNALGNNKWNLVVMDYKLTQSLTGTDLIEKLRNNGIYTPVVFYSSDPQNVQHQIKQTSLEGVYWATRDEDLEDTIIRTISLTLNIVMDVNTMRGLVMAVVADMDQTMEDIIRSNHTKLEPNDRTLLVKSIIKRLEKSHNSYGKKLEKISEKCQLESCLDFRLIDSDKRLRTVVKQVKDSIANQSQGELLDQCREVIGQRNLLAHGKTVYHDGELFVQSGEKTFKLNDALGLRNDLRKHKKNLLQILNSMDSGD